MRIGLKMQIFKQTEQTEEEMMTLQTHLIQTDLEVQKFQLKKTVKLQLNKRIINLLTYWIYDSKKPWSRIGIQDLIAIKRKIRN